MGIFDKLKSKKQPKQTETKKDVDKPEAKAEKKEVNPALTKDEAKRPKNKQAEDKKAAGKPVKDKSAQTDEIKGGTAQAYRVLIKPLITEKATDLGALNKYVFAIDPKMNKVEVKKALRSIYKVDPVQVNIENLSGKKVRYGRISGTTKSWKKAIVTLKAGDKIEVYEGV